MRKRIKRALAAFLKEELFEIIGYKHNLPMVSLSDRFKVDEIDFETLVFESQIPLQPNDLDNQFITRRIARAKDEIASKLLDHIHVEAQDLATMDGLRFPTISFVLRVQTKKK